MYDPIRRNRHIGTSKQGYGQNNKLSIPQPALVFKTFYERLGVYEKKMIDVAGKIFTIVIEETRENSKHACSVSDIEYVLKFIPAEDLDDLSLIIFRQPKRKEEILSSAWGRLIYYYEFENDFQPAIVIEAVDYDKKFKWGKHLSPDARKELDRLISDGHKIIDTGRFYEADYIIEHVRNTQLYRTVLHEIGHYVHYLNIVVRPGMEDDDDDARDKRENCYDSIPVAEKERFAHNYADQKRKLILFDAGFIE